MKLTVVIPTYNEAGNLPDLAARLFDLSLPNLHILVVDDSSPDGTAQIARQLADQFDGRISILERPNKMGLGTAYLTGFRYAIEAGAQAIAQMDADFSHPPEKLVELVQALDGVGELRRYGDPVDGLRREGNEAPRAQDRAGTRKLFVKRTAIEYS